MLWSNIYFVIFVLIYKYSVRKNSWMVFNQCVTFKKKVSTKNNKHMFMVKQIYCVKLHLKNWHTEIVQQSTGSITFLLCDYFHLHFLWIWNLLQKQFSYK